MTTYAERRKIYFDTPDLNTVMRAWGREHGYVGARGGWIYHASGQTACQGWWTLWSMSREDVLDWLTRRETAFQSFEELLQAKGSYFPSICLRNAFARCLASAYDQVQAVRGDARRAYTYYGIDRKNAGSS